MDPKQLNQADAQTREELLEAETRMYAEYFGGSSEDRKPLELGILFAILAHFVILYITFPEFKTAPPAVNPDNVVIVKQWRPPPPPKKEPPKPVTERKLKTKKIPIPDPTPEEPEPIKEPEPEPEPEPLPVDAIALIGIPEAPPVANTGPLIAGVQGVSNPEIIEKIDPIYPALARQAGLQGKVFLQMWVMKDGSVANIQVISSNATNMGFEEAAIEAVQKWKYRPAQQNGRPVDVVFNVKVDFTIN